MQRFFVEPASIQGDRVNIVNQSLLHQMNRVLRMASGVRAVFLDNTGWEYESILEKLDEKAGEAKILEKRMNTGEPTIFLTLFQALPKKRELFEWVLQKGTEIGVSAFVPLITERTERREIGNLERLRRILQEAAEQSERGKIPELHPAKTLQEFMSSSASEGGREAVRIMLHGRGAHEPLSKIELRGGNIALAVGPEGGFSENEVAHAKSAGWHIASLGPRVLRTETAGIAGAAVLIL